MVQEPLGLQDERSIPEETPVAIRLMMSCRVRGGFGES